MIRDEDVIVNAVIRALAYVDDYERKTTEFSYIRPRLTPIDIGHMVARYIKEQGA
jgi:hypothetical protein